MTVQKGSPFLDFTLGALDTGSARKNHPLFMIFWRTGCSTCRFALPFFDKIARSYPAATVVGICQDDLETTREYCEREGIAMRQVVDEGLTATRRYGLKTVPSYVLTDREGLVLEAGEAWDRDLAEAISKRVAEATGAPVAPIVGDAENVPAFKPG